MRKQQTGPARDIPFCYIKDSVFSLENTLGYLLAFDKLIDTSPSSGLVFRPLAPALQTSLFLVWKKYQTFSPIAERFLSQIRTAFENES